MRTTYLQFFAESTEDVWLKVEKTSWGMLPLSTRELLMQSRNTVANIRKQIMQTCKVQSLPSVEIVGAVWRVNDGLIDGCVTQISVRGRRPFGVQLPASTAVCPDAKLVRAVLVHEFLHCFWYCTTLLNHHDSLGSEATGINLMGDPFDRAMDDERTVDAEDWFGPEDVESSLRHNDPRLGQLGLIAAQLEDGGVRAVKRDLIIQVDNPWIPGDITAHIRNLRRTKQ